METKAAIKAAIEALAARMLDETRERLARQYSEWQADREQVRIIPGRVYTKIDMGSGGQWRGALMVENATGLIYGIKAYGKVHRGWRYGNLWTVNDWYWGDHTPRRKPREPVGPLPPTAFANGGNQDLIRAWREDVSDPDAWE